MAGESFEVTLTDEQLEAARGSAAARGVSLGPVGSMSRDLVTVNYTITSDGAGNNVVAVTILHQPFYVPVDTVQTLITEFLMNPPPPAGESAPKESHAAADPAPHAKAADPAPHGRLSETSSRPSRR
jgi:S1-C subfamily serine protease